ncbi:hypothetical protein NL676_026657 [Syzygium grande]|nr:hypothetical protein NL676_026657 [Syzygium grande]
MKHLEDQDDEAVQKKMKEINDELKEKEDELTNLEDLNSALLSEERHSNDELQEVRKELIQVPSLFSVHGHTLGIIMSLALSKILDLEEQLDRKQKLEMEIEELKGKVEVMKHHEDQDDEAVKKKMKEINDELKEKENELTNLEDLNSALISEECQSNDEMQEAR